VERQIRALGGGALRRRAVAPRGDESRRRAGLAERILESLRLHGPQRRRDLERRLAESGMGGASIGQTLAYLRARGKLRSVDRGTCAAV
jgi:hypothetical protein